MLTGYLCGGSMLYDYKEAVAIFGSDYKLKKAIAEKNIFKIEKGIYSDGKNNYDKYELILKKYPKAFLVKESALFYIGFIKEEPEKIHIGTARNALRIDDERVRQHFYSNVDKNWVNCGSYFIITHIICYDNVIKHITDNKNEIRILALKALLYDVIRDSKSYSKQYLDNLLSKFNECSIFKELDVDNVLENMFYENIPYDQELMDRVHEIDDSVQDRKWDLFWN